MVAGCFAVVHVHVHTKISRLESDLELDPVVYKREKERISFNGHKK